MLFYLGPTTYFFWTTHLGPVFQQATDDLKLVHSDVSQYNYNLLLSGMSDRASISVNHLRPERRIEQGDAYTSNNFSKNKFTGSVKVASFSRNCTTQYAS